MDIQKLTDDVFKHIKKVKGQVINFDKISELLKEKLGDDYTNEIGVAVKSNLRDHEKLEIFREGEYISNQKYHYCVGNWIAIKGLYDDPIKAKSSIGLLSWQRFEDDWEDD